MPPAPIIDRDSLLRKLWLSDLKATEIAAWYGVHIRTLRNAVNAAGLPPRAGRKGNKTRFRNG
jgi:hypothetical protein